MKNRLQKHLQYLRYVLRHKYYVFVEGRKLGLGITQLLLHDYHKFFPDEWFPYVDYFYGGRNIPPEMREAYYIFGEVQRRFDVAWLKHQHRAPHHWQHWLSPQDDGGVKVLEMPDKYRREMLADWRGMGRAFGEEPPAVGWYEKNREKMQLHSETRAWVEEMLFGEVAEVS